MEGWRDGGETRRHTSNGLRALEIVLKMTSPSATRAIEKPKGLF